MNDDVMTRNEAEQVPLTLPQKIKKELREWGITLSIFIPVFLIFSGLFYELRVIPSESMVPNLQVGDRVTVNKFAYGYSRNSLPFSLGRYVPLPEGRIFGSMPKRGDTLCPSVEFLFHLVGHDDCRIDQQTDCDDHAEDAHLVDLLTGWTQPKHGNGCGQR